MVRQRHNLVTNLDVIVLDCEYESVIGKVLRETHASIGLRRIQENGSKNICRSVKLCLLVYCSYTGISSRGKMAAYLCGVHYYHKRRDLCWRTSHGVIAGANLNSSGIRM